MVFSKIVCVQNQNSNLTGFRNGFCPIKVGQKIENFILLFILFSFSDLPDFDSERTLFLQFPVYGKRILTEICMCVFLSESVWPMKVIISKS